MGLGMVFAFNLDWDSQGHYTPTGRLREAGLPLGRVGRYRRVSEEPHPMAKLSKSPPHKLSRPASASRACAAIEALSE